jgi:hypothetical protein
MAAVEARLTSGQESGRVGAAPSGAALFFCLKRGNRIILVPAKLRRQHGVPSS